MRYAVLALLSGQQYLAVSFLYAAVPAWLRANGASLAVIGWFGVVFAAFTLNVLWAPLVDRRQLLRIGLRRGWILCMQLAASLALAAMAALSPRDHVLALLGCSILLAAVAATQRIATLGYATETLAPSERGYGAAAMGWGMSLGNAVGGLAGLLSLQAHGWPATLYSAALLMAVLAASVFLMKEPARMAVPAAGLPAMLRATMRRPGLWRAVALTCPASFGVAIAFSMTAPWLVDLGFELGQAGLAMALATLIAFSTVGPLWGWAMRRVEQRRAVLLGALTLAPALLALALLHAQLPPRAFGLCAVLAVFCALAVQSVSFNAYFYSLARPGEAATDVTLLTAVMSLAAMAGFATSGYVAQAWGYTSTLLCAALGYACTALLARAPRRGASTGAA
ncbi:MFS transporter [Achromobacter aloeverae]